MRDSAAQELITAGSVAREISTSPAAADASVPPGAGVAVAPLVALLSLLVHVAVLAAASFLPAPPAVAGAREPSQIIPFEPRVEPPAPVVEPPPPEPEIEPPPEPQRAAVVAPRPRPRRQERRVEPERAPEPPPVETEEEPPASASAEESAPPAEVLTSAEGAGGGGWSHPAGEPGGVLGGQPGGRGTRATSHPVVQPEPGISPAEQRRLLRGYIRETLSRYLAGRIDYPLAARREQLEGVVTLRIRLARDGRVLGVRLARSSGHSLLDRAALAAVEGLGSMPAPPREIPWDDRFEFPLPVTFQLH